MEEEGDIGLDSFFTCEVYVEKKWTFEDLELTLLASGMASTDHDLTGQIVWPASVILSWFIYKNPEYFHGKSVIELGAGCGLAGFLASFFSRKLHITDGNEVVCRLLNMNKDRYTSSVLFSSTSIEPSSCDVNVNQMLWGLKSEIISIYPQDTWSSSVPEVIIGADVILWPNHLPPLLKTIRWLLLLAPTDRPSVCFISYVVRALSTSALLHAQADRLGLTIEDQSLDFLPLPQPPAIEKLEKRLLKIQLREGERDRTDFLSDTFEGENEEELQRMFENMASPC